MSRGASADAETGSRASTEPASGFRPTGFDPAREPPLTVSGFLRIMVDRFKERTDLDERDAWANAGATLEAWEVVFGGQVELTEDCAREIVDGELEHWDHD